LTADELELLLYFLDRLLKEPPVAGRREATLQRQRLRLVLEEPSRGDATTTLATATGRFTVPAYTLTVEPAPLAAATTAGV
jgi:Protein of unknown function (DUF2397)